MSVFAIPVSKQIVKSSVLYIKGSSLKDAKNNLRVMFKNDNRSDIVKDYSKDNFDTTSTPWEIQGE
jgi:hypothetical protein